MGSKQGRRGSSRRQTTRAMALPKIINIQLTATILYLQVFVKFNLHGCLCDVKLFSLSDV
jgi:hypothetical protein